MVVLAGGAALVLRQATGASLLAVQPQETARKVLDERLGRGEITREEYEDIRTRLER